MDVRLRALTPVGEALLYNYFPVCGSPSQWTWGLVIGGVRVQWPVHPWTAGQWLVPALGCLVMVAACTLAGQHGQQPAPAPVPPILGSLMQNGLGYSRNVTVPY